VEQRPGTPLTQLAHGIGHYRDKRQHVLIEHMEEKPTRWLLAEYAEAHEAAARAGMTLLVTGVRDPALQSLLSNMGIPWEEGHAWELADRPGTIVLDMWAARDLEPVEAGAACCFVVGGIMGDYPPRMRGALLTGMFDWASTRRMGREQMTIHTAVWAVGLVASGTPVNRLPLAVGGVVEVETPMGRVSVELPYAYPRGEDGRPRVPERVARILARGVVWDEEEALF